MKSFYIRTYGCQMNELDSENLAGLLTKRGLLQKNDEKDADLIIFNTCSIRDLAERKVFGKLGLMSRKQKKAVVGIAGCMAMTKKDEILKKFPIVDFVLGTNNIFDIDEVLDNIILKKERALKIDEKEKKPYNHRLTKRKSQVKASISIIRGCNNFCSYCIVPYTRGREVSKHPEDIIKEFRYLIKAGYKDITLLGQNVNSYANKNPSWNINLPSLLENLDKIEGKKRIRFLTSHPKDITIDLMNAIKSLNSVCEFLHLPVQSGSTEILKKMARSYSREKYLETVGLLKEIIPNISLGTDIIVGFPGEREKDLLDTVDLLKKVNFSNAFIFAYSRRKNTPAALLKEIPVCEKKKRLQHLLKVQKEITKKDLENSISKNFEVLIDTEDERYLKGRTRCNKKVLIEKDRDLLGKFLDVKIYKRSSETLFGKIF